ncbi:MAG: hypothetical protein ACI8P9_004876 [Parasphingorhabdus sp.]|jgi:hypothetical protein
MKSLLVLLVTLISATASINAMAILPFSATPASGSLSVSLSALVNLNQPSQINNVDESTLILDLLKSRGITLNSVVTGGTQSLSWILIFPGVTEDYSSGVGTLSINGVTIGSRGASPSADCTGGFACVPVPETLVLTAVEKTTIAEALLAGVTLGDVLQRGFTPVPITLEYSREWTAFISSSESQLGTFSIVVGSSANIDVKLNQTRLLGVTGTTTSSGLPIGSPATVFVNMNWVATLQSIGTPVPITFKSTSVEILTPDGRLIQRINRPLSNTATRNKTLSELFPSQATTTVTQSLTESISLPPTIAVKARQFGANRVIVRRTFSEGFNSFSSEVSIPLTSASAAGFQITRVDLRFADNSRVKVAYQGEQLQVLASINYLGTGQIQAMWEWAPLLSGGQPLFRPLPSTGRQIAQQTLSTNFNARPTNTLVREFLTSFQHTELVSPVLPAAAIGGALVRLRITAPAVSFALPVLRYYVGPEANQQQLSAVPLTPMTLRWPTADGDVSLSTEFKWQPVDSALYYQYECFGNNRLSGDAIAAAVAPATDSALRVSAVVMDNLTTGEQYWCRMIAIDAVGRRIAESAAVALIAR